MARHAPTVRNYTFPLTDAFSWFAGTWKVVSECTNVLAPCGIVLFGGNRTYEAALAERGPSKSLNYESRFLVSGDSAVADREFNVKSIARVAMFLLPSQDDPMALQMWQATRGRPIDVRYFNVRYEKK